MQNDVKWEICDDSTVLNTVKDLIEKHHQIRCDLQFADIGILWKLDGFPDDKAGECKLVSEQMKPFFKKQVKFIITLDFIKWNNATSEQKIAIIDHELCHCDYDENDKTGEIKPYIRKHDLQEFNEIVNRHGQWHDGIKLFVESIKK